MEPHQAVPGERQKTLTIANIQEIDNGRVAQAVNQALQAATRDVLDRPGDKTARKVVLTVEMKPEIDKHTNALDTIANEFTIETKIPKRRSTSYPMLPGRDGVQFFQPASPFDPRQGTFGFADGQNPGDAERAEAKDDDTRGAP